MTDVDRRSLRPGDIVIEKSGGGDTQPVGRVGLFTQDVMAIPTNFAARLRPAPSVDPRFVCYLLASMYFDGLSAAAVKQTTGIQNLDMDALLANDVQVPVLEEQRAIADYLDAETARIDALIAKKQQLIHLLEERVDAVRDSQFDSLATEYGTGPIAALARTVLDCVNKTAPTSERETGYLMIRTSNVRDGQVSLESTFHVEYATYSQWTRRGRPQRGDVLLTREAPVGEVGILDTDQTVFLGQRLVMYRPDPERSSSDFIAQALQSRSVQEQMTLLGSGSLHEHLRVGDCSKFSVPLPPRDVQDTALEKILRSMRSDRKTRVLLEHQLELLAERRQALISAAVTGEFKVPGAR